MHEFHRQRFAIAAISIGMVLLGQSPSSAQSHPGDENWDARFYMPGGSFDNIFTSPSGEFYVNSWGFIDSIPYYQFPKWNGSHWASGAERIVFGSGAKILAVDSSGLYASGSFIKQSGDTVTGIGKWNGIDWVDLGLPKLVARKDTIVYEVSITNFFPNNGKPIITGNFNESNGQILGGIARWEGDHWFSYRGGIRNLNGNSTASTIIIDSEGLFFCGSFQNIGDSTYYGLARWDNYDSNWHSIGDAFTSNSYGNAVVNAIAWQNGRLYVGGTFTSIAGKGIANIAYWDGKDWNPIGLPKQVLEGSVSSIIPDGENIHVLGNLQKAGKLGVNSIATWTGVEWTDKFERRDSLDYFQYGRLIKFLPSVSKFFIWHNNYYCVTQVTGEYNELCMWKDSLWTPVEKKNYLGLEGTVQTIVAENDTNVFVGGQFRTLDGKHIQNLARWNGTEWLPACTGRIEGRVNALFKSGDSLFVGGNFVVPGTSIKHIALIINDSIKDIANWQDSSVSCIYKYQGTLYAGYYPEFTYNWGIAYLSDSGWISIGPQTHFYYNAAPTALSQDFEGRLLAAGSQFCQVYDGSVWSDVGPDTILGSSSTTISTIFRTNDNLFFGGRFLTRNFSTNPVLAILSRAESIKYNSFFTMEYPDIFSLAGRSDTDIYAIGNLYQELDGRNDFIYGIGHFNGNTWKSMGSGIDYNEINAIATIGDNVFAGGSFYQAGDKNSSCFAIWHVPPELSSVKEFSTSNSEISISPYPNPAVDVSTIEIASPKSHHITVTLEDPFGRKLQGIFEGILEGRKRISVPVSPIANGVYILSVQNEMGNFHTKLIVRH